jgi:hypothetical protein
MNAINAIHINAIGNAVEEEIEGVGANLCKNNECK